MSEASPGRRERKKAATRQAIADAALELFLKHGYDAVSMRDIAEAADVSITTLFTHFSGKEALVFDRDTGRESELVAVVHDRPAGETVLDALRRHVRATHEGIAAHPQAVQFAALVSSTPALRDYSERMWTRHTAALGAAIAGEVGADPDDLASQALARFVLDIPALVRGRSDAPAAIDMIFDLLDTGWTPRLAEDRPRSKPE